MCVCVCVCTNGFLVHVLKCARMIMGVYIFYHIYDIQIHENTLYIYSTCLMKDINYLVFTIRYRPVEGCSIAVHDLCCKTV